MRRTAIVAVIAVVMAAAVVVVVAAARAKMVAPLRPVMLPAWTRLTASRRFNARFGNVSDLVRFTCCFVG
jgi:hypothetical protein